MESRFDVVIQTYERNYVPPATSGAARCQWWLMRAFGRLYEQIACLIPTHLFISAYKNALL
jgi:hypothetical protein